VWRKGAQGDQKRFDFFLSGATRPQTVTAVTELLNELLCYSLQAYEPLKITSDEKVLQGEHLLEGRPATGRCARVTHSARF